MATTNISQLGASYAEIYPSTLDNSIGMGVDSVVQRNSLGGAIRLKNTAEHYSLCLAKKGRRGTQISTHLLFFSPPSHTFQPDWAGRLKGFVPNVLFILPNHSQLVLDIPTDSSINANFFLRQGRHSPNDHSPAFHSRLVPISHPTDTLSQFRFSATTDTLFWQGSQPPNAFCPVIHSWLGFYTIFPANSLNLNIRQGRSWHTARYRQREAGGLRNSVIVSSSQIFW